MLASGVLQRSLSVRIEWKAEISVGSFVWLLLRGQTKTERLGTVWPEDLCHLGAFTRLCGSILGTSTCMRA